jgi:hypothetical protein
MLLTTLAGWPAKPAPLGLDLAILKGTLSATSRAKLEQVDGWPSLDPSWGEAVVAAANYVWLLIDTIEAGGMVAAPAPSIVRDKQVQRQAIRGDGPRRVVEARRQAKA